MPKKRKADVDNRNELNEIDEAYQKLSGYTGYKKKKQLKKKAKARANAKSSKGKVIAIIVSAIVVFALAAFAFVYFLLPILAPAPVLTPENVTIAGVNFGSLEQEEALEAVTQIVNDYYADKTMTVTIGEESITITPDVIGAKVDVEAIVSAAFALGASEDPAANMNIELAPYLTIDEYGVTNAVKAFESLYPTEVIEHTWEIVKETTEGTEETPATETQKLVITMGKSAFALDVEAVSEAVINQFYKDEFSYSTEISVVEPQPLDLDAIYTQYCTQAVDAVMDPETFEVSDHIYGYSFNLDSAKEAFATAKPGDVLEFPFETIVPQVMKETLEALLFRDVLSSYTAKAGSNPNRNTNLKLSCEAVDGLILYPGDVFNYNKTLGQRTEEKGYKPAASYVGNETVDTVGGGICQTSSSIYYCALLADLQIVQRHNHTFISSYMPFGMDATVDWSGPNFRFKNNTNYPIKIEAKAKGGNVTIRILGTDEKDYYVKMKYEVVEKTPWETQYVEIKMSENKEGYKDGQVLTSAYTGYEIKTYKYKYDKETNELISKTLQTHDKYAKRDKRVVRLIDDTPKPTTPPTTPTEPVEKPTEPTTTPTEPVETPTEPAPENNGSEGTE